MLWIDLVFSVYLSISEICRLEDADVSTAESSVGVGV